MPRRAWFSLAPALLVLCAGPARAVVTVPPGFTDERVVSGLDQPIDMAFLPDGRVLFVEHKTGRVRLIVANHIAAADPILTVPDLFGKNYRGLMAITVDPHWPARPYVYLYYSRYVGGVIAGRLVRYTAGGDLDSPTGEDLALANPLLLMDDIPDDFEHIGGGLRFGPTGHLFMSIGQCNDLCRVQDSTRFNGKVLRMQVSSLPAGGGGPVPRALLAPPDNPLAADPDSNARLVWGRGFHNCWRLDLDPVSGNLFVVDPGETRPEEINEVGAGDNLGWPWRAGLNEVHTQAACPEPGGPGSNGLFKLPIHAYYALFPGYIAVSDVEPYRPLAGATCNWPAEYHGDLFFVDFYRGHLRRLKYAAGAWEIASTPGQPNANDWATGLFFCPAIESGPDGSLWWLAMFDSTGAGVTGSLHRLAVCASTAVPAASSSPAGLVCAPNPFTARVEARFRLPRAGRARLALYDLGGRRVRTLLDGDLPAGDWRGGWDGRDEAGRVVPPGVYLARLERPGRIETVRLLRLR